jgi:small-conductance mechanosensitive channel/CRP-like cAMP-binding protein
VTAAIWARPWLLGLSALAAILVLARLARLRPSLRPIVAPFALTAVVGVGLAAAGLGLGDRPALALLVLLPGLVLLVRLSVLLFQGFFERSQGEAPPALLDSVLSVALYGLGAGLIAKSWFGLELTPLLATSAVVGAVVGLALQETLGNLFTGIALHTEAPFHVGDWVRVGDQEGRVEQVSWRATRLRTWTGDTLTIPNVEVSRRAILNFSVPRAPHSRILVIGVSLDTPPNKALDALGAVLRQVQGVPREPPAAIRVLRYGESSVDYEVRYFVDRYDDYRRVEGEILRLVWYHFRRLGIGIPFPVRDVFLHSVEPRAREVETPATRLARTLRSIDLFQPLTDDELRSAAGAFRHLHYAAGERIIQEGDGADSFFVIDRGEAEVLKAVAGVDRPVAHLAEGQFFGEMALLTGERRAATVVAVSDVDLFTLDKAGFHDILAAKPGIAEEISAILAARREALSQAEGDLAARFETGRSTVELKQRILDRIRGYFGL